MSNLPKLSRATAADADLVRLAALPERVLQFGGGNFLRGFVDVFVDQLNRAELFNGRIVVVQSTAGGRADALNQQDGLFTVVTRGMKDGKRVDDATLVASVSRGLSASTQWPDVLAVARSAALRVVVSNTTEAGIALDAGDTLAAPKSFPARLTAVLYERFRTFGNAADKGLIVLPCELIERNGTTLARLVKELSTKWELPPTFARWVESTCTIADTLVDRIVPGFPSDDAAALSARLGYRDDLLVAAEPYHLFAIQDADKVREELPFDRVGLNVVFAPDLGPYRERKVRILNGGHTGMALGAFLAGKDTVGQCMDDAGVRAYLDALMATILPTLNGNAVELRRYAADVFERFANPFVKHQLLAISLNSSAKYKARLLPATRDVIASCGNVAPLAFALAALLAFYRGTRIEDGKLIGDRNGVAYAMQDAPAALEAFREHWAEPSGTADDVARLTRRAMSDKRIWGEDLTTLGDAFVDAVARSMRGILDGGAAREMARVSPLSPVPGGEG